MYARADILIPITHKTTAERSIHEPLKNAIKRARMTPKKISIISHYIDTHKFQPHKKKVSNCINILFVGRLEEYKGIFDIVMAVSHIIKTNSRTDQKINLTFVGNGSKKSQLITSVKNCGISEFVEIKSYAYDQMPLAYADADIFLAPSKPTATWEEQYCTALLEAQAAGLAIITTKTGGIPENIGSAGVLIEPGDVVGLIHALQQFISNISFRYQYGKMARMRAEKVHALAIGAMKLKNVYE
jgi:glycosyltransferase involved in cell wall biosynthesis